MRTHSRLYGLALFTLLAGAVAGATPLVLSGQEGATPKPLTLLPASTDLNAGQLSGALPAPVITYERTHAPILEGLATGFAGRSTPLRGSQWIATASGYLNVGAISEAPEHYASMLDTPISPDDVAVVHFGDMPMERVRGILQAANLTPLGQVPNNAMVVTGVDASAVEYLNRVHVSLLAWTPGFFVPPDLGRTPVYSAAAAAETTLSMKISVFPGTDTTVVAGRLEALGGTILHTINGVISFSVDINDLRAGLGTLTGLPIRAFAETARFHSQDEDTNSGVQVGKFRGGDRPYTEAGIDGTDQIIGITDTGLSLDSAVFAHAESDPGVPGPGHRKIQAYVTADAYGGAGDLLTCDGVTGATHGHLVASIAAAGASPLIPDIRVVNAFDPILEGTFTAEAVDGLAAGARVFFIDDQVLSGCTDPAQIQAQHPGTLSANAQTSQDGGARIHNFSFAAAGSEASYTLDAQDLDTFLAANTSFLVVVAAGNKGTDGPDFYRDGNLDFGTVTAPGTAKNVLTVGSSGYPNNELDISQSVVANTENNGIGMISRWNSGTNGSGQGPAAFTKNRDGGANWRIKPDLMAPGNEPPGNQRLVAPTACASRDNDQAGEVECSRLATGIFTGTSFASAATAGAAALVRDYFSRGHAPAGVAGGPSLDISGIELKAALIASADLMTGNPLWRSLPGQIQQEFYTPKHLSTFTPEQGYGRIQLNKLLPLGSEPNSPSYIHTEVLSVPLAGSISRTFSVVNPDEEARCVVSWYDEEATLAGPNATGELIHNIDMVVKECGATCGDAGDVRYNGNYFSEDADFDGELLQIETTFNCSNYPGIFCRPGPDFDPGAECGDPLAQCVLYSPEMSEDCNFNGTLDFSEFSLPVYEGTPPVDPETGLPRPHCPGNSVDINNNNEAVFLSPAQIQQGDLVEVHVAWPESSAGAPPSHLDVALVCTGGLAAAGTPDSVRLNKGRYTCADILEVTAIAPASSSAGDVRQAVTVSSYDATGLPLDSESGLSFNSNDLVVFSSHPMAVVDAATNPPAANDLILAVESNGSIVTTYGDAESSASVRCTPQLQISNIVRRGINANYGISGGCDPLGRIDPRTIIQSAIPGTGTFVTGDLFLDANEDLVYQMGFTNQEEGDPLQDVKATLKACVAGSILADGSCTTAEGITIHDPVQSLGAIHSGDSQKASFNLHVSDAVLFPVDQVQLVFGISAARNGLTLDSTTVIAHVLDQDRWSLPHEDPAISGVEQYSTDYPLGGREIRVYSGEFFDPAKRALAAEEFLFSDMTDTTHGGGSSTILGFNPVTGRFDTPIPNNMPWTFDLEDEQFGARRRFDSDPGDNLELAARNTWQWNNTGECGFQSNDASQADWEITSFCSNDGVTSCDPQNYDPVTSCGDPLATCEPANRGTGGMWHTGHAESMAGTPDGRTGYDLGCENYDLPGSADPRTEQVIDSVSSPIFFRVHQTPDDNGFAYQVEFTRLGFNLQYDLGDNNAIIGYELDPDTSSAQPVDPLDLGWLASDQGTTGFLSGVSQQAYQAFNPNDPQEGTSITVTPGGTLDATGTETNNILAIHGPGSAGPFYEVGNANKAPARQFGELQGLLTGRGITSGTRRGAGGFPVRNYDNDLRESFQLTFEDIYGANESGDPDQTYPITAGNPEVLTNQRNSFQTNFTMILREDRDAGRPAIPSYGVGFDDVVVEWRESHPVQDRTPCSDPSTWAMDYSTQEPVGSSTTCIDGPLAGLPCSSDAGCGSGVCSARRSSGCAQISWDRQAVTSPEDVLTVTVIDSNAQFGPDGIAGTGDEQAMDSNNDGFVELIVPVSSDADLVGEQLVLTQIALVSPVYKGTVAVSTTKGLSSGQDGTLFIQQNGDGNNPTSINAFYNDQDINVAGAGFPAVPCPDNPLVATAMTRFVGADISFVTAAIRDVGPNADGDFIADPGETIEMDLTMISNVLGVRAASGVRLGRGLQPEKPVIEDVTITLLASSLQVGPDNPIACILDGETFMGDLHPGFARTTDPSHPLRWVVGDVSRSSLAQVLQARFRLGISGHYTDNNGIVHQVTSFSTPQQFGINLDLDVLPGGGQPVSTSFACVGGSLSGRPCMADADCPGQRFDLEGGGPRTATCDPLPDYLSTGGTSLLAGKVGYFESFEGADNMAGRLPDWGPAEMAGTSFEQLPALFPVVGGYLERFVRDTLGRGVLEGLSPGSTPGGRPDDPQGSSAVDGSRCQFNDIQGPGKWRNSEFFCRPWAGSDWHVNDNKAFTGNKSLYAGVNGIEDLGRDISFDGNHTNALQAAFSGSFNVGVSGGASLSLAHIVATADDRTFSVPFGNAVGRTYLEWTEVDPSSGTPVSAWRKVDGFQNSYSSVGVVAFFSNCVFSSYDEFYDAKAALGGTPGFDVNATNIVGVRYNDDGLATEDDYFDPNDPLRLYGPSNGCYPQFVFSSLGNYSSSDPDTFVGRAFTGGELGETGTGVWIKSIFSLDEAAGRTIRVRLVLTDIDIQPGLTWPDIFGNALGNATRGWRVDDFAVSGLVDAPTVLAIDGRFPEGLPPGDCPVDPDPGTPGNAAACNQIIARAGDDLVTPVSGSPVSLDAAASSSDMCVDGHLEYQWDVGGGVIQPFSTNPVLRDAPRITTTYNLTARCSTDNACRATDQVLVMPGDQLEASGSPSDLLAVNIPVGFDAIVEADEPSVGGPCELYLMSVPVAISSGPDLREKVTSGSVSDLAAILRTDTCTEGMMLQDAGTLRFTFNSTIPVNPGDVQGYMANPLCGGVVGSLGLVKEGDQGIRGSRGRLNPNAATTCEP